MRSARTRISGPWASWLQSGWMEWPVSALLQTDSRAPCLISAHPVRSFGRKIERTPLPGTVTGIQPVRQLEYHRDMRNPHRQDAQWNRDIREPTFAFPRPVQIAVLFALLVGGPLLLARFSLRAWTEREGRVRREHAAELAAGLTAGLSEVINPLPRKGGIEYHSAPGKVSTRGWKLGLDLGARFFELHSELEDQTISRKRQELGNWLTTEEALAEARRYGIPADVLAVSARSFNPESTPR